MIAGVVPKTPAADLGPVPGDTITSLSGTAVTSGEQLQDLAVAVPGWRPVSLTWRDSQGGSHTASVTLIDGPAE